MDLSSFDEKYRNDEIGRLTYDSKIRFRIVLSDCSAGLIDSGEIEQAASMS